MTGASKSAAVRTVLVADDTAFVRDRFSSAIQAAGYQAVTARNGNEVLAQVREKASTISLIVLDLRLPRSHGVGLLRALQKLEHPPPVVVFSGTIANADEVRQLDTLGVVGYVNEYATAQHILPALVPHLFPDRSDRRASPRVVLGVPVSYRFKNTIAAALTLSISHGGLAIRTTSLLDVGTSVKVRFRLPAERGEIEADAKIVWTDRRLGMGLRFTKVSDADQKRIDGYVRSHFFSNRKA